MRLILHTLSAIGVVLLALNAYNESFKTRSLVRAVRALEADRDAQLRRLHMLQAEYSYLTRPERLRDLAIVTFDTLGLQEISSDRFVTFDELPTPAAVIFHQENDV
jgi:hypothetical protein